VPSRGSTAEETAQLGENKAVNLGAIVFALAAATGAFVSAPARARDGDCSMPHFHFNGGGVTWATMSVRRGTSCQFHFEIPSSTKGIVGIVASMTTVQPKNGLLGKIRHTFTPISLGLLGPESSRCCRIENRRPPRRG